MIETVFFVVLVLSAAVIFVKGMKRRKRLQEQWREQPCRSYKPELDELEDVQRRESRRPL